MADGTSEGTSKIRKLVGGSHKENESSMNLLDVGKSYCHFCAHGSSVCLEIVFSVKLEGGLLKYKTEHFCEKMCSYRRAFVMDVFRMRFILS